VAKLKNEIERSQIYDPSTFTPDRVSFAAEVTLFNETENKKETFVILGPWESDPPKGIISYLSPLGKKLLNHKVGDSLIFAINERKLSYQIKDIKQYAL